MKIYVGGSKNIDNLPECVQTRLKELAGEKDEFIIGVNAGADVRLREFLCKEAKASVNVYVPEDDDVSYEDVNVTHFKPRYDDEDKRRTHEKFMHGSFVFPDADYSLLKDAEYGFFIWDGESLRTFMNILEMVWYKKPVEVYLAKTGNIYKIEKAEDLKELVDKPGEDYVGKWDIIPEKYLDIVVNKCMTSQDMRDFYLGSEVYKNTVADMILFSPVPLQEKREVLDALAVTDDRFYELVLKVCKGERSNWCDGVEGFYHDIHDGLFTRFPLTLAHLSPRTAARCRLLPLFGRLCRGVSRRLLTPCARRGRRRRLRTGLRGSGVSGHRPRLCRGAQRRRRGLAA